MTTIMRAPATKPTALVIVLHGVGSSGIGMTPLVDALANALPGAAIVAPDGFEPFDLSPNGRQWFSVKGVTSSNRRQRVEQCMPRMGRLIGELQSRFDVSSQAVALVGFSQGAIMGLYLAATSGEIGVVAALAGRLVAPVSPSLARRPALFISHGTEDHVIPIQEGRDAAAALVEAQFPVELQVIQGHGHAIHSTQLEGVAEFLATHLPSAKG